MISILKTTIDHSFVNYVGVITFLFSAHCLMIIFICPKACKISLTVLKIRSDHDFLTKNYKRE